MLCIRTNFAKFSRRIPVKMFVPIPLTMICKCFDFHFIQNSLTRASRGSDLGNIRCFGFRMNGLLHIPLSFPQSFLDEFFSSFLSRLLNVSALYLLTLMKIKTPYVGLLEARTWVPPRYMLKSLCAIHPDEFRKILSTNFFANIRAYSPYYVL